MTRSAQAALWCCLGAGFATLLDSAVVAFTAPAVQAELHLADSHVQWFLASYSLTFGLGLAPAGRIGDAFGRRTPFVAGLLLFLVGAALSAAAPSALPLIGGRLVQGLGAGIISAQVLGVIQDVFTGPERLRALARYTGAGALAAIAGPLLAGAAFWLLPAGIAWRVVLLLPVPFVAGTILLGLRGLPRIERGSRANALDLPGIAVLGALVVLVTLPVIEPGLRGPGLAGVLALCALLTAGLIWWERYYAGRGMLPLFAPALVRSLGYVVGNLVALLWFGSSLAFTTVKTVYFLQACDIAALVIAAAMIPSAVARLVSAGWGQRLFARWGPALVTYGLVLQTGCLALSAGATLVADGWPLFAVLSAIQVLAGISGGVVEPPLRAVTLAFAPSSLHGVAASFLQLTQRLSATFCIALGTGVLLAGVATAGSLGRAVLLCALASLVATAASFAPALRADQRSRDESADATSATAASR